MHDTHHKHNLVCRFAHTEFYGSRDTNKIVTCRVYMITGGMINISFPFANKYWILYIPVEILVRELFQSTSQFYKSMTLTIQYDQDLVYSTMRYCKIGGINGSNRPSRRFNSFKVTNSFLTLCTHTNVLKNMANTTLGRHANAAVAGLCYTTLCCLIIPQNIQLKLSNVLAGMSTV